MKLESLVIADQHAAVNTFSSLVLSTKVPGSCTKTRSLKSTPLIEYQGVVKEQVILREEMTEGF